MPFWSGQLHLERMMAAAGIEAMQATRILVISPSDSLGAELAQQLPPPRYEIVAARPGSALLGTVRRERPAIAIVDRIDDRCEAAQLEIAVLKEMWPDLEIIARSLHSSERDAWVAEQGVFYYTAALEVEELVRVIHAAEHAAGRKQQRA